MMAGPQEYPWDSLSKPTERAVYSSRMVDPTSDWFIYWTVDAAGREGLLVNGGADRGDPRQRLPRFRELLVSYFGPDTGELVLTYVLLNHDLRRVFLEFCKGLTAYASAAANEAELLERAVRYTWSWRRFLRGKQDGLTPEEQRGLIGELVFLQEWLAPTLGWHDAILAWGGPKGTPKDFAWASTAVEVKTHVATAQPVVRVSSERQLDPEGLDNLYLAVVPFQTEPTTTGSRSLHEVVEAVRTSVERRAPEMVDDLDSRLDGAGYTVADDYSESWATGPLSLYLVRDGFPAITGKDIPLGVCEVRYAVSLTEARRYCIDPDVVFPGRRDTLDRED